MPTSDQIPPSRRSPTPSSLEGFSESQETKTPVWFAVKPDDSTFAVFDAFEAEDGRQAHLDGRIAAALMANAAILLAEPPRIEKFDVVGVKLPG